MILDRRWEQGFRHLHDVFPHVEIYLFGSQARGMQNPDSDIDLCVVFPEIKEDPFELAYQLRRELRKYIPLPMDLIVVSSADFIHRRTLLGTLEYAVASEGIAV